MARKADKMPARNKKNFRPTKKGAGMTEAGVKAYRKKNPGSKLKTAVTGKVKPGSKDAKAAQVVLCPFCRSDEEVPQSSKEPEQPSKTGSEEVEMLTALIGPISQLAGTWLEGKVEKTKAETGAKVAIAKAEATIMEKKATGEIDWDLEAIKGSQNSWKDEWLVILFSVPLILAFIPGMEDVVSHGFQQLEQMPEWYQYSLGVIVAASFGVRSATKFFGKK